MVGDPWQFVCECDGDNSQELGIVIVSVNSVSSHRHHVQLYEEREDWGGEGGERTEEK